MCIAEFREIFRAFALNMTKLFVIASERPRPWQSRGFFNK